MRRASINFSIKQKLLLITMTSSTVALLLFALAFLTYQFVTYRATMVRDLITLAQITGSQSTAALTYGDKDNAHEILRSLSAKEDIVAAGLYTSNSIFADQYFTPEKNTPKVPDAPMADGESFAGGHLALFRHIQLNGETIGGIYLRLDLQGLYTRLWHSALTLLLVLGVCLFATYLMASRLQRIISQPISHLAQTAETVSIEKNYSIRAQKKSDDELGQLISGFNEMLGQIQKRDSALKNANDDLEKRVTERTRDLEQQFSRISLLNQITYAVAKRQDFASIIMVVLQQLEDHLPVDYGSAYWFDEKTKIFSLVGRGPKSLVIADQLKVPNTIPLEHTLFHPCLNGQSCYVPDMSLSDLLMPQKMAQAGFFTVIAAPLMAENKMFGVLVLQRRQKNGFSAAERQFIGGLSAHVALAVHQAQLYQDLQKAYNELHQTQQTVMQQERLKALGQMASGIAHDINNALSPIVGFSELIARTTPNLDDATKKYLGYIKTAGEDITHIVASLREFYRMRDENECLSALNLNQVVEQVIDMTRSRWRDIPQARNVLIEMKKELSPCLPELAGDESEMREALTNLIINAVDALPVGGDIIVRTFQPPENSRQVVLEVRDTGIGMDEQTRKRCLEPFFSTKGRRGTGLGLAMVYGVVERHEGRIEIESAPGKGTLIRLIFPIRKVNFSQRSAAEQDVPPGPFNILCVDDEATVRELLQEMLRHDGHQVVVADGGHTGLETFRAAQKNNQPFDVVITDLGMPKMDGREVVATLRRESPGTPVIMLTGWGVFMNEDDAMFKQVDGILGKPPRIHEIRAMLRQVLTSN